MNKKSFLSLAIAMLIVTITSCSNELVENRSAETNIMTKSIADGASNSNFPFDGIPDYIAQPLIDVDGLDFYRTEISFNDYEVPESVDPEIHGYYISENDDMREKNFEHEKFGFTCVTNYVSNHTIAYELRKIPTCGFVIIHTVSHHNNGNVYDRYIKVAF